MVCKHSDLRYRLGGKALVCETCKAEAEPIICDLRAEIERLTVVVSKCSRCCMELKDRAVGEHRFSDAERWRAAMLAAEQKEG
jgi:hypothetical protein